MNSIHIPAKRVKRPIVIDRFISTAERPSNPNPLIVRGRSGSDCDRIEGELSAGVFNDVDKTAVCRGQTEEGSKILSSCGVANSRRRSNERTSCPFQQRGDQSVPLPATMSINGSLTRRAIRKSVAESRSLISATPSGWECQSPR